MTVVVAVKISDGIAAASDSASSLVVNGVVHNIYNNANKIFNLRKGMPIGAMTAGSGSIGGLSISTISKDFRASITGSKAALGWTVKEFSERFFGFIKDKHYDKQYQPGEPKNPKLTLWVFGFSPKESLPEIWSFSFGVTHSPPQESVVKDQGGMAWGGEPELIQRVILGYGSALPSALKGLGVDDAIVNQALEAQKRSQPIVCDAMPIQDAIDLAEFLVRSTIEFSRFKMGAATVGGPVEIAAVTKHEGFKWIKRKHYFDASLNPPLGGKNGPPTRHRR